MNYEEQKAIRKLNCNLCSIWGIQFTPFWQWATIWTKHLSDWAADRAAKSATYTLIKGVSHEV